MEETDESDYYIGEELDVSEWNGMVDHKPNLNKKGNKSKSSTAPKHNEE